jgi:DNA-binding MarR family transcriptional regulator
LAAKNTDQHEGEPTYLYRVKQLELSIRVRLDQVLRQSKITVVQYTALTVLRNRDGLTSAQLARRSFVTPQSISDVVVVLADRGLILRRDDPTNGSHRLLSLSGPGRTLLRHLDGPVRDIEAQMLAALSYSDRDQFRRNLESCYRSLNGSELTSRH